LARKTDVKERLRETVSKNAEQFQTRAGDVMTRVRGVTPEQVQSGLGEAAASVRERPFPFAVAGAFCFGLLIGRWWGRDS
jgi:hypothetical protein